MKIKNFIATQIRAAHCRRRLRKTEKAHGRSGNLNEMLEYYRALNSEYAAELEKLIYPLRASSQSAPKSQG